jgi:kumamolisin
VTIIRGYVPLRHSEHGVGRGGRLIGPADPDELLSVSIRVRRRSDAPLLPRAVARGRAVLSRRQFAERFGAAERDLEQAAAFGRSHGLTVTERSVPRRTVVLSGTVGQASRAFGVALGRYESGDEVYRGHTGSVHVPAHLAAIIEGVFGLGDRRMARRAGGSVKAEQTAWSLTPPEVAALYDFPTGIDASGQTIGLIEFTSDGVVPQSGYQASDINAYFETLALPAPNLTDVGVDGAVNPGILPPNPEVFPPVDAGVTLDIDVAGSVAPGANIVVYFAPQTEQGWVDVLSTAVHDTDNTPSVIATGWGFAEQLWSRAAIEAMGATFQEAAQLGVTVFAASGDGGAQAFMSDGLTHVLYPASDPFVTSCGGTQILDISGSSFNEATFSWPTGPTGPQATGGGVSDIFDPPAWQAWADVPAAANLDARVGRGVPDVAGQVGFYTLVRDGGTILWGGTEAVPPLYAGLVALMDAALGEPVGYLNPNLYTLEEGYVFRDINDGVSNGAYTSGPGWDACTGLGSIDGNALLDSLRGLGLPPALAELTRGTLHMAWKGMEFDDTIWWSTFDGTSWAPQQQVPGVLTSSGVSLAEFNGKLVMAWKGSSSDGTPFDERIWWATFDGTRWARQRKVPNVWTSVGPQLAFFNGLLYMLWKGEYVDESIWWTTFDGDGWSAQQVIPGVGTSVGAAAAAFQQRLYATWKGIEGDPGLWWSSFDGSSWDPQRQIPDVASSHGPSLAVFEGRLYAAWKGWFDDPGIYWSSFDGVSWLPQQQIPEVGSSLGPGLIGLEDGPLYAAWKGEYGDEGIYWSSFDGANWAPQQSVPNVGTSPDV